MGKNKGGDGTEGAGKKKKDEGKGDKAASASKGATTPSKFYLLHGDDSVATLKVSVAASVYGIEVAPRKARGGDDRSCVFLTGPALAVGRDDLVFGGNAICKFLSMAGHEDPSLSGGAKKVGVVFSPAADNWLEWEREVLRPALVKAGNGGDKDVAKLDDVLVYADLALQGGDGVHLVGDRLTVADIAVICSLHHAMGGSLKAKDLPPALAAYVKHHVAAPLIAKGIFNAPSLLPPPPLTLDVADPGLLRAVEYVFACALEKAFPDADPGDLVPNVGRSIQQKFGDFQCNNAMPLFPKLRGKVPGIAKPQDVSRAIVDAIPADNPVLDVDSLEVNGPGFVLCRIKSSFLASHVQKIVDTGEAAKPTNIAREKVVVDFSSPNIAKEMHVGHLRSTIIGESVSRILEYSGCEVVRMNHLGDWGTQFGMLIQYLKEEFPNFHENPPNITDLTQFYKNAKARFDDNPDFKKLSQLNVPKLQSGDPESTLIWNILCDVSRKEFQKVYDRLDVTIEEYGESFYNSRIQPVIEEFENAGLVEVQEGGAKCVFLDCLPVPLMLQKSDGGFGYDSTDMAALRYRTKEIGATRVIVITDFTQADHFKLVYEGAEKIGWVDRSQTRLEHIGFGTVQGEDGKRFKTRSGDTVRLVDLLDEAVRRMEESLKERMAEGKANITEDVLHKTASAMGYGAVKYFDLRRNPTSNYKFSYDQMLDTKGNTAIYLLYAHARLESICAKAKKDHNVDVEDLIKQGKKVVLGHPSERNLALNLLLFADTIETTLVDLFPYHICEFLYNSSMAATDFVTNCKVLGSAEMESRLLLCRATTTVMRQCFNLLGLQYVMSI